MSSTYVVYILDWISFRRLVSNLLTNQFAKRGANGDPIDCPFICLNTWLLKQKMLCEQVFSMFLNTFFVIFDLVNTERFSFEYTSSATMFIVSSNGTHVYRLFMSKVLQTSPCFGFMVFKESINSIIEFIIHLLFSKVF